MRRIQGLDGLRGVAVLLVVVAHLGLLPWEVSGMHGVTIFFVLSGYLITSVLLRDDEVDFGRFYRRRARRLLPALALVLAVSLAAGWFTWRMAILPLTYTSSVAAASGHSIDPVRHTWSLSVEEHFYLIWPWVFVLLRRKFRLILALIAAAIAWRVFLRTGSTWQRVYYGTDAHAFAILMGCALALARANGKARRGSPKVGLIAVLAIVAISLIPSQGTLGLRLSLTVPVALLAVVAVNSEGGWRLEWRPLAWLGTVSYSLYLWHWILDFAFPRWPGVGVGVTSLFVAWMSWIFVERPILTRTKTDSPRLASAGDHSTSPGANLGR